MPLYLGVPFTISVQTGVGFSFINRDFDYYDDYNYEEIDYPDEATFQLYEGNDLTPVNSIVLPDPSTSVPEPSTQAATLALLIISVVFKRRKKSSPPQEPHAATPRW